MSIIAKINQEQMKKKVIDFNVGDSVRVHTVVKEGDTISIDIDKHTIELEVPAEEIAARLKGWKAPAEHYETGVFKKYVQLVGSAAKGYVGQADVDIAKMRTRVNDTRNRIGVDTAKSYQDVGRSESAREVARLDLDVAREQVTVLLAQLNEGRVPNSSVDQARMMEQEKWIAYYDAQNTVEKAKLNVLRLTGTLVATLR